MPKEHEVKLGTKFFDLEKIGYKKFSLRKNDRDYQVGDTLVSKEYLPLTDYFTGDDFTRKITYVMQDYEGLEPGYVILGWE